jgi:hypothetical protein
MGLEWVNMLASTDRARHMAPCHREVLIIKPKEMRERERVSIV